MDLQKMIAGLTQERGAWMMYLLASKVGSKADAPKKLSAKMANTDDHLLNRVRQMATAI